MKRKREKALEAKKKEKEARNSGGGRGAAAASGGDEGGVSVAAMEDKMSEYIEHMKVAYSQIKAGRAQPALLDDLPVNAHGQTVPLRALGTVSARNATTLVVQLYDPATFKEVDKAIRSHNNQLNPQMEPEGGVVVAFPKMTKEVRQDLVKQVVKRSDETRNHLRDVRTKFLQQLRAMQSSGEVGEDLAKDLKKQIQNATDGLTAKIKKLQEEKEKEIQQV